VIGAPLFAKVSRRDRLFPTLVMGPLEGVPPGEHLDLALAVNGRLHATGRSFDFARTRLEYYSLMVPESALRSGANRLELLEIRPGGGLARVGAV
jgi:hypothetical protein